MFDNYKKMLDDLGANTDEIFSKVAQEGAIHFRKEAVRITNSEGLVDTGNYKRNWDAKAGKTNDNTHEIVAVNTVEYASHLEYGYTVKKDYFVPFDEGSGTTRKGKQWKTKGMVKTPKTKEFISKFKAKYPDAKGFIRKAGHYKGHFVGRQALDDTDFYCIEQLDKEFEKAYKQAQTKYNK